MEKEGDWKKNNLQDGGLNIVESTRTPLLPSNCFSLLFELH